MGRLTATAWPNFRHSLSELYLLLAQNRISPRRAAVLSYGLIAGLRSPCDNPLRIFLSG